MATLFQGDPDGRCVDVHDDQRPGRGDAGLHVVAAERPGVPAERLSGTIQTDILKEYIAQKEWCFPIEPAMRLVTDMVEFCARRLPRWHPISISGYHIREAGSTAQQSFAFTLKDGFTYVEQALARGLDVDEFAPRLASSSTPISTSSRRSPSTARRGGSGPASWRRPTAPRRALAAHALPRADRRCVADRPATAQQHRAHRRRGAVRRAGRHPVAAHEFLRRGARAADRGGGARGPADAADPRARDRGDAPSTRSAARTSWRR